MKREISLKIQKIVVFVPLINFFETPLWIVNCALKGISIKDFAKSLPIILFLPLPWFFLNLYLADMPVHPIISNIYYFLMLYLIPLTQGLGLIMYQKRLYKKLEK